MRHKGKKKTSHDDITGRYSNYFGTNVSIKNSFCTKLNAPYIPNMTTIQIRIEIDIAIAYLLI
jgi:hypothetical protein